MTISRTSSSSFRDRFTLVAALLGALLNATLPLAAVAGVGKSGGRTERTVTAEYQSPGVMPLVEGSGGLYACTEGGTGNFGCVSFDVAPSEKFVEVVVEDATGLPAPVLVYGGTHYAGDGVPVCGATEVPIRIARGTPVEIWIKGVSAEPLCPGVATSGTVTVTFADKK